MSGTELYATYHTVDQFPAVYDDDLGLFVYARLVDGRFESSGVPIGSTPPPDVRRDATEAAHVRAERISEREAHMNTSSHSPEKEKDS